MDGFGRLARPTRCVFPVAGKSSLSLANMMTCDLIVDARGISFCFSELALRGWGDQSRVLASVIQLSKEG